MTSVGRRTFLAGSLATLLAACSRDDGATPPTSTAPARTTVAAGSTGTTTTTTTVAASVATTTPGTVLPANPFTLGIASGDPLTDSVILWTRLTVPDGRFDDAVPVTWEVSLDETFADLVTSGVVGARADDGHSVHVDATGLAPGTWYRYRFRAGGFASAMGRTRTMPSADDAAAELVLASASCQSWDGGYYAAHRDIAASGVDLVLWLGDYIYEYAGGTGDAGATRQHPPLEATTIEQYRDRYALYKSDEDLQAAHAAAPWLVMWDDHEVENNAAGDQSEDVSVPAAEFRARRAAAYRAWWEHQPVRLPRPDGADFTVYRSFQAGALATFILLDGRQYRSDQACGDKTLSLDPPCPEVTAPGRTMLGDVQEAWFDAQLAASTATWNVLGNQVVLTDATVGGAVLNYDQWDGYPEARGRLVRSIVEQGRSSTVVVTGDIHLAGVGKVRGPDGAQVAVELITTSISSPGNVPVALESAITALPDVQWGELRHRGWTRHEITPAAWTATYRIVDDVRDPKSAVSTAATFLVEPGRPVARQI